MVPTSIRETDILIDLTSSRAAEVFNEEAKSGDTVGIAWGRTCHAFMSRYAARGSCTACSHPPHRGEQQEPGTLPAERDGAPLRGEAAGHPFIHPCPALAASREDFELYMGSSSMKEMLDLWRKIDVAVLSVGSPPVSEEFDGSRSSQPKEDPQRRPASRGRHVRPLLRHRGPFVDDQVYKRIIGIPVESLRRIKKSSAWREAWRRPTRCWGR